MKKTYATSITAAACFAALSACEDPASHLAASAEAASATGCDGRMWIGVRRDPNTPCAAVHAEPGGSWFTLDPFASALSPPPARPVEMCTYIWQPGDDRSPSAQQLKALFSLASGGKSPLVRLEQSCLRVSGMSDVVATALMPIAHDSFLAQVDPLSPLPQGTVPMDRIKLALVDSVPDWTGLLETTIARHAHGRALGMMIYDLAGPDPTTCPIDLSTHLAFGRRDEVPACPTLERGDFVGRPAELAVAIHRAVDGWQASAPGSRMVINLSVGWEESSDPAAPGSMLAVDTLAVLNAIEEASCYGALIIAASGNTGDGPNPPGGPLFPAAWELRPTLTHAECSSELGINTGNAIRAETGALLHSVGAVDGIDRPAASVRPGARPRLAAPAQHLAEHTILSFGTAFDHTLSGSSVAAAVASTAAVVAWSYRSAATAAELADLLYDSGEPLSGHFADYCPVGRACDLIHRISMCGVVQAICSQGSASCPSSIACNRRPAFVDASVHVPPAAVVDLEAQLAAIAAGPTTTAYAPECEAEVTEPENSAGLPCPSDQYASSIADPADHPQPGETPCPLCVLTQVGGPSYKLFIAINPQLAQNTSVYNGSVELTYANGSRRFYTLPLGALAPGAEVQVPMTIDTAGFVKATISFLIDGAGQIYSSRDPLVLD